MQQVPGRTVTCTAGRMHVLAWEMAQVAEMRIPAREAVGAMPDWAHQFDLTSRLLYPLLSQSARCHRHAVHAALTSITSLPPILSCAVPAFSLFFHPLASAAPFFVIGSFSISFSISISRALTAGAAGPMPAVSMGAHTPAQLEMCVSSPPCQLNPTATCSVASPMASQQPMSSRNTIQVPDQMKRQISFRRVFEIIGAV